MLMAAQLMVVGQRKGSPAHWCTWRGQRVQMPWASTLQGQCHTSSPPPFFSFFRSVFEAIKGLLRAGEVAHGVPGPQKAFSALQNAKKWQFQFSVKTGSDFFVALAPGGIRSRFTTDTVGG